MIVGQGVSGSAHDFFCFDAGGKVWNGLAFVIWNLVQQGNTGQTVGKKQMGIRLLREQDGQVVGPGLSIGRAFVPIVDSLPCYIGWLFPLWDAKRQTLADKILHTVVVVA